MDDTHASYDFVLGLEKKLEVIRTRVEFVERSSGERRQILEMSQDQTRKWLLSCVEDEDEGDMAYLIITSMWAQSDIAELIRGAGKASDSAEEKAERAEVEAEAKAKVTSTVEAMAMLKLD